MIQYSIKTILINDFQTIYWRLIRLTWQMWLPKIGDKLPSDANFFRRNCEWLIVCWPEDAPCIPDMSMMWSCHIWSMFSTWSIRFCFISTHDLVCPSRKWAYSISTFNRILYESRSFLSLKSPPALNRKNRHFWFCDNRYKECVSSATSDSQVCCFCNAVRTFWIAAQIWQVDSKIPDVKRRLCSV